MSLISKLIIQYAVVYLICILRSDNSRVMSKVTDWLDEVFLLLLFISN